MTNENIKTDVLIVGAGPSGLMLAYVYLYQQKTKNIEIFY